ALVVDAYADPVAPLVDDVPTRNTVYVTRILDDRARLLGASGVMDDIALDRYLFMRDGYLQRRRSLVYDGDPPPLEDDYDDSWLDEEGTAGNDHGRSRPPENGAPPAAGPVRAAGRPGARGGVVAGRARRGG